MDSKRDAVSADELATLFDHRTDVKLVQHRVKSAIPADVFIQQIKTNPFRVKFDRMQQLFSNKDYTKDSKEYKMICEKGLENRTPAENFLFATISHFQNNDVLRDSKSPQSQSLYKAASENHVLAQWVIYTYLSDGSIDNEVMAEFKANIDRNQQALSSATRDDNPTSMPDETNSIPWLIYQRFSKNEKSLSFLYKLIDIFYRNNNHSMDRLSNETIYHLGAMLGEIDKNMKTRSPHRDPTYNHLLQPFLDTLKMKFNDMAIKHTAVFLKLLSFETQRDQKRIFDLLDAPAKQVVIREENHQRELIAAKVISIASDITDTRRIMPPEIAKLIAKKSDGINFNDNVTKLEEYEELCELANSFPKQGYDAKLFSQSSKQPTAHKTHRKRSSSEPPPRKRK